MSTNLDFLKGHTLEGLLVELVPRLPRLEQWMRRAEGPARERADRPADATPQRSSSRKRESRPIPFILVDGKTWVRGYHKEERSRFSEAKLLEELRAAIGAQGPTTTWP